MCHKWRLDRRKKYSPLTEPGGLFNISIHGLFVLLIDVSVKDNICSCPSLLSSLSSCSLTVSEVCSQAACAYWTAHGAGDPSAHHQARTWIRWGVCCSSVWTDGTSHLVQPTQSCFSRGWAAVMDLWAWSWGETSWSSGGTLWPGPQIRCLG